MSAVPPATRPPPPPPLKKAVAPPPSAANLELASRLKGSTGNDEASPAPANGAPAPPKAVAPPPPLNAAPPPPKTVAPPPPTNVAPPPPKTVAPPPPTTVAPPLPSNVAPPPKTVAPPPPPPTSAATAPKTVAPPPPSNASSPAPKAVAPPPPVAAKSEPSSPASPSSTSSTSKSAAAVSASQPTSTTTASPTTSAQAAAQSQAASEVSPQTKSSALDTRDKDGAALVAGFNADESTVRAAIIRSERDDRLALLLLKLEDRRQCRDAMSQRITFLRTLAAGLEGRERDLRAVLEIAEASQRVALLQRFEAAAASARVNASVVEVSSQNKALASQMAKLNDLLTHQMQSVATREAPDVLQLTQLQQHLEGIASSVRGLLPIAAPRECLATQRLRVEREEDEQRFFLESLHSSVRRFLIETFDSIRAMHRVSSVAGIAPAAPAALALPSTSTSLLQQPAPSPRAPSLTLEVETILREAELLQFASEFAQARFTNRESVLAVNDADLVAMGIHAVGERKLVLSSLARAAAVTAALTRGGASTMASRVFDSTNEKEDILLSFNVWLERQRSEMRHNERRLERDWAALRDHGPRSWEADWRAASVQDLRAEGRWETDVKAVRERIENQCATTESDFPPVPAMAREALLQQLRFWQSPSPRR